MVYYYAYTGHKIGLERAKRGSAMIKALIASGFEAQMLVNDFRAGIAMKEQGVENYVTVETVQDIDAIASMGDVVIIDSPEDHRGRLEKYCSEYKEVFRFAEHAQDRVCYDEIIIKASCEEEGCIDAVIVDDVYFEKQEKKERLLFFFGDADYDKTVLNHKDFFQVFNMELLLGYYFFLKYETELTTYFSVLHEPEYYTELLQSSSTVVTASGQTALEAKVSGAKVIYMDLGKSMIYPTELLLTYGITVVKGFDMEALKMALASEAPPAERGISRFDINKIVFYNQ